MNSHSLVSSRETPYFVVSIIISAFIYLIATLSMIGIGIALVLLVFILCNNAIMIGSIRGNGIRISEKQFPDVYERVVALSETMQLKAVPDVFVIQSEGAFNAFATRFLGRNMVIIYSEVFELARERGEKELDFIIAHELAHIKRRHIWKHILTIPANFVPFLSQAYSRACEYTCDRMAAYYIEDGLAAKRALTILGIGKVLYHDVDEVEYLEQIHSESNVAVWFAELLSTHPMLPKRIQAIGQFMQIENTPSFQPNAGKIAIGATISGAALAFIYVGALLFFTFAIGALSFFLPTNEAGEEDVFYESDVLPAGKTTPLMEAASFGDVAAVEKLLMDGAVDIHAYDEEFTTALHYAVYNDELEVAELLLREGDADPNDADAYTTALTAALDNESYIMALLLYRYGADPTVEDAFGDSGLSYFDVKNVQEFQDVLAEHNGMDL